MLRVWLCYVLVYVREGDFPSMWVCLFGCRSAAAGVSIRRRASAAWVWSTTDAWLAPTIPANATTGRGPSSSAGRTTPTAAAKQWCCVHSSSTASQWTADGRPAWNAVCANTGELNYTPMFLHSSGHILCFFLTCLVLHCCRTFC